MKLHVHQDLLFLCAWWQPVGWFSWAVSNSLASSDYEHWRPECVSWWLSVQHAEVRPNTNKNWGKQSVLWWKRWKRLMTECKMLFLQARWCVGCGENTWNPLLQLVLFFLQLLLSKYDVYYNQLFGSLFMISTLQESYILVSTFFSISTCCLLLLLFEKIFEMTFCTNCFTFGDETVCGAKVMT